MKEPVKKLLDLCGELAEVRVMAVAEGWAIVRRKGCIPFACREDELKEPSKTTEGGK